MEYRKVFVLQYTAGCKSVGKKYVPVFPKQKMPSKLYTCTVIKVQNRITELTLKFARVLVKGV